MDEFSSQLLGYFTLALYCSSPSQTKDELNYLRLEWGPDFQQHEAGLIAGDEVPVLTTSSAELASSNFQSSKVLAGYRSTGLKVKAISIRLPTVQRFHARYMQFGCKTAINMH